MLSRKPSESLKDYPDSQSDQKHYLDSDDPKLRILQYDLVFVTGLPSFVASKQILNKDIYFGRYGKVIKSILNPPYPFKKGTLYQAYATYENQLNASLAIVALDGFSLSERPLKVSYGTTKYCSHFLRGRQCTNNECFYLHQIQKQREVLNGDTRAVFREQNDRAIQMIVDNLEQIIERIIESKLQRIEDGFPSLTETVDFLIDNDFIDQNQYDALYQKVKNRKNYKGQQKKILTPSKIVVEQKEDSKIQRSIKIVQAQKEESKIQKQESISFDELPKLIKSNSFSTMASPSKPQASIQFYDQKRLNQIYHPHKKSPQKIASSQQLEDRTVRSDDENTKFYQHDSDSEDKLQQKISQKIIKEIMRKKSVRSRFDFLQMGIQNMQIADEAKKVKNIIQRFLITYQ